MSERRLLLDLPNWIGDVAMALPAVASLVDRSGFSRLYLHCRPQVVRLLSSLVDGTQVVPTPVGDAVWTTARHLREVAGERFDVGVTFRHSTRAKLLLRVTARRRVGSRGGGGGLLLTDAVRIDRGRHQVFDPAPMLARLDAAPPDASWRPEIPAALSEEGRAALGATGVDPKIAVGLCPGAAWGPSKRWPLDRFGELARRLLGDGLHPVVLIGPGEEPLAAEIVTAVGPGVRFLGARLDVAGLFAVLAQLPVIVCNDSGPMHLAALAGTRVVALFGPTDPGRTAPLGAEHVVLSRELDCAPCFEPVCPLEHHVCLAELPVDEVLAAVRARLG